MRDEKNCYGIDVSAKELVLSDTKRKIKEFSNDELGHKKIVDFFSSMKREVYVCLEATGIYSLDIATALSKETNMNVMVANPKVIKDFSGSLNTKSKTDKVDATVLALFALRMDFKKWSAPSEQFYQIRNISRRIQSLKKHIASEKCRLHAYKSTAFTSEDVIKSAIDSIKYTKDMIKTLINKAIKIVETDEDLTQKFKLLVSMNGVAKLSAIYILSEIAFLTEDISPKQLTSYVGLDPRKFESGSSVRKIEAISKKGNSILRRTLFLPALVAIRRNDIIKGFFNDMVSKGKQKKQVIIMVMRRLLHAIIGMFRNNKTFNAKLCFNVK